MKFERMEVVGLSVNDLDAAMELFSGVLGVEFVEYAMGVEIEVEALPVDFQDPRELATGTRIAIDRSGFLELIESPGSPEGMRNIHFKVHDIEAAITDMRSRGLKLVWNLRSGNLREAVFDSNNLHGLRLCLTQYDGPSMVEAALNLQ